MLHELVRAIERFRGDGTLDPVSYRPKRVKWVIELGDAGPTLKGPFKRNDLRGILAPHRGDRSGKIGPENLKPYLLLDNARYALGIAEPGKGEEVKLAHQAFVQLITDAWDKTGEDDLESVLNFLTQPISDNLRRRIAPGDMLTFQSSSGEFLCETEYSQRFWANYLGEKLRSDVMAECAICRQHSAIMRIFPDDITVMGQDCQVTSFNLGSFTSFGRSQTTNVPICSNCAATAVQALNHTIRKARYHSVLTRDESLGQSYPLRNQLAVYWLNAERPMEDTAADEDMGARWDAFLEAEAADTDDEGPPPALAQAEAFLKIPYTANENATYLRKDSFQIAVLTGNKGRLMVRDWISVSLEKLRHNLLAFLDAVRIVDPSGEEVRAFAIPALIAAVRPGDPNLTRSLVRMAYLGFPAPQALLEAAVLRTRIPTKPPRNLKERQELERTQHIRAAAMKLVLTYGKEDAKRMERLDPTRDIPAYLCGKLLAVLEEIQRRAATGRLNSTLVDRYFSACATSPKATFGMLIRMATTAHLPKVRRLWRGYGALQDKLTKVLDEIDKVGGFPPPLPVTQQAEFALGYYHQRAEYQLRPDQTPDNDQTTPQGGTE